MWLRRLVFSILLVAAGCSADQDQSESATATTMGQPERSSEESARTASAPTSTSTTTTTAPLVPEIWVDPVNGNPTASGQPGDPIASAQAAIELASPGDTIYLVAGTHEPIAISDLHGEAERPITIRSAPGGPIASVTDGDYNRRASIHIEDSSWIVLRDLALSTSLWAVDTYRSQHLVLDGLVVTDIGQEAIHFRENTSFATIRNSSISRTGQRPEYDLGGSGVYIGTARGDDQTHDILVENNEIYETASEGVDVKAATYNVTIRSNRIHDIKTLQSGAVVLHLGERPPLFDPNLLVEDNDIWNIESNTQWADGNAIVIDAAATVRNNRLWNTQHRGILVEGQFLEGQPTNVTIVNNVIFNSGRFDIEIKGDDAVVSVEDNFSSEPIGNGFTSSGNQPATQDDFDSWTAAAR